MRHFASQILLAMALATFGCFSIYRPLQLGWGATQEEVLRAMPGDAIQQKPVFNATRAITIRARREEIWPWLMQIGFRRVGWYGYDWIDNDRISSSEHLMPEWQFLKIGDGVPIWGNLEFPVVALEPKQYLVLVSPSRQDSMALGLYPVDATHTRLV